MTIRFLAEVMTGTHRDGVPVVYRPGDVVTLTTDLEEYFLAKALAERTSDVRVNPSPVSAPTAEPDQATQESPEVSDALLADGPDDSRAAADEGPKPRRGRPRK